MAFSESFKDYVLEQLIDIGNVTVKKMFGGAGLYLDGIIFALIAGDVLYFKVDDSNRIDYKQVGMGPFQPFDDKPMVMPYYEVPADVLENREQLADWAKKAIVVSINTPADKKRRKTKCSRLLI
jgi:DNA transformation protein